MNRSHPLILGHRGSHETHPENSLAAFSAALLSGADGVECDLQKTAAGAYVIMHDPPGAKTGAAAGAPTLQSMLGSLPTGSYLNLELKADTLRPEDCAAVLEILRRRHPGGPLLISSFEPRLLVPFKEHGIPVGLLMGKEALDLGITAGFRLLRRLRPEYLNLPILMFEVLGRRRARALIAAFRLMGFSLAFWTVNTEEELGLVRRFSRIIITDDVASIRGALGSP